MFSYTKKLKAIGCLLLALAMILPAAGCKRTKPATSYYSVYEVYEDDVSDAGADATTSAGNTSTGTTSSGKTPAGTTSGGSNASGNTSKPVVSDLTHITEDIKDVDVKGYTYTITSVWLPSSKKAATSQFEKVLFQRMDEIEKEYGCKFKIVNNINNSFEDIQPLIMAGKKVGDIVELLACHALSFASAGYIVPWSNTSIDTSYYNYTKSYTEQATFNGKVYGLQFEKPMNARTIMVFNKDLINKHMDANSLYTLVRNKQWTFDKFKQIVNTVSDYNNGIYGIGGSPIKVSMGLVAANGGSLATLNGKKVSVTLGSEKVRYAMDYFNSLVNTDKAYDVPTQISDGTHFSNFDSDTYYANLFNDGKLAFWIDEGWVLEQRVKGKAKFNYGVLPLPMGPGASNYTSAASNIGVWTLTSTMARSKDIKKSLAIFKELSKPPKGYEGDDWWAYDIMKNCFQSNSEKDDFEMFNLCINTSKVDIGYGTTAIYEDFIEKVIYDPIFLGKGTTNSGINSIKDSFNTIIDSMYNNNSALS